MENASKALIIAGAILLAILIISLGIMVYNQAKSTVSDASLDSEAAQTFNAKFTSYFGTISGSRANAMIQAVVSENGTNTLHSITVSVDGADYTCTGSSTYTFNNSDSVIVNAGSYDGDGYLTSIVCTISTN